MDNNYLREYVYIDQLEINSLLAQYNKGLKTQETKSEGSSSSASKSHKINGESKTSGKFGVPFLAEAAENLTVGKDKTTQTTVGSNSSDSLNIVPSDYSVEILENYIQNSGLVNVSSNKKIGSFVRLTKNFKLINFNMIKNMTSPVHATNALKLGISEFPEPFVEGKNILLQIKQLQNLSKENGSKYQEQIDDLYKSFSKKLNNNIKIWSTAVNNLIKDSKTLFSATNELASFAASIFPNTVLIYSTDYIIYAELDHFRMSEAQLQMLQGTQRKLNILGIIENISKETDTFKGKNIPQIKWEKIADTTLGLSNVVLRKAGILHDEMLIIKPLALYFS